MSKKKKVLLFIVIGYLCMYTIIEVADFRVGFDYDDTMVFSTPAFVKGFSSREKPFTKPFWKIVNSSYKYEKTKKITFGIAVLFKVLGFDVYVITARDRYGSSGLVKKWDWFLDGFYFGEEKNKFLSEGKWIFFFGDSDSDITEARNAGITGIRIKRSPESSYKSKYHPGKYGEFVVPFSE